MSESRGSDFAYQAVYRYLTQLISEPGSEGAIRLPSLRQLAERLGVSISTIQYAYALLEKEGRVYSVAKSGYFAQPTSVVMPPGRGSDLLETVYVNARCTGMQVLSADEPASIQPLDRPLLMLERELLRQYPRHLQTPAQPCGELELRTLLAARYTSSADHCWHAEDVYIGADLRGVLEILIAVLELRHSTVVVESPCDWMILRLFQSAEVRVIELPLQPDGACDPQNLQRLLESERVRLILLSSRLNMPHGSRIPPACREAIADLLLSHGTWLLENDCHGELLDDAEGDPLRELVDPDRLLVFSMFEKIIGVEAPYGFVISRQWRADLQRHFLLRSFRLSPIRQKAIARLYASGRVDQHLPVLKHLLRERRTQWIDLMRERLGDIVQIVEPQGGATIWLHSAHPIAMDTVFQRLLKQHVLIAPGELFSLQGLHAQYMRVSVTGSAEHELLRLVGLLGDALRLAPRADARKHPACMQ
ncbi:MULTISPECIES: PLP-dependent aminotransferase family protein [Pseudomonas]|uniref:PLP-dependent aminotransferase family protein n=1 Tax=Pseudomonas glycinae TaxID=1785145 RepID=A0ABM5ZL07_9PSED|nr:MULTISPECIES: PLP-dependent aminotransferase family protein [Pseudomonas]AMQ84351.1 PLP-dependent aminotransferase family protein [Pseudomonas glycinae]NKF25174.1 PLP-dependent aminotransferase family protein [Pseudomonas sp. BG5]